MTLPPLRSNGDMAVLDYADDEALRRERGPALSSIECKGETRIPMWTAGQSLLTSTGIGAILRDFEYYLLGQARGARIVQIL